MTLFREKQKTSIETPKAIKVSIIPKKKPIQTNQNNQTKKAKYLLEVASRKKNMCVLMHSITNFYS